MLGCHANLRESQAGLDRDDLAGGGRGGRLLSPNLTKLAAEGQAKMLAADAESRRAAELVKQSWPDEAYEAMAVAVLHRPGGLTEADRQYALRLSQRFEVAGRPARGGACARADVDPRNCRSGW